MAAKIITGTIAALAGPAPLKAAVAPEIKPSASIAEAIQRIVRERSSKQLILATDAAGGVVQITSKVAADGDADTFAGAAIAQDHASVVTFSVAEDGEITAPSGAGALASLFTPQPPVYTALSLVRAAEKDIRGRGNKFAVLFDQESRQIVVMEIPPSELEAFAGSGAVATVTGDNEGAFTITPDADVAPSEKFLGE